MNKKSIVGLILIVIGTAWILDLTGVVSVDWSEAVKTLWPIVFIAAGISMVAGRHRFITILVWILTFAAFIGFGIIQNEGENFRFEDEKSEFRNVETEKAPADEEIAMDSRTEEGLLVIDLGAAKINIEGGEDDLLAKLETNITGVEQQYTGGRRTVLKYIHKDYEKGNIVRNFVLHVNGTIPWEMDTTLSVVDGKINIGEIPVKKLNLELGAGDLDLVIGNKQDQIVVNIEAGAADLDIYIPENAGLMVRSGKILSDLSFHNINMTNEDDIYISDNYEEASQKIEMNIQSAVSTIEIFAQ